MSRRYDSQTTTFSPEGRVYQVEYAIAAIQNAAAAVGVQCKDGIVIVGEKNVSSTLLAPPKGSEKIFKIDDHIAAAVAGLTSDANILINEARLAAQRYKYTYSEDQPVEQLVQVVCDYKHGYTQHGGLRPFGVAFLFAGWDKELGFQLFQSDPAGNFSLWKAAAIGSNSTNATSNLKNDYVENCDLDAAIALALKTLTKAMDTTSPNSEKIEVFTLTVDETSKTVKQYLLSNKEVDDALAKAVPSSTTAASNAAA